MYICTASDDVPRHHLRLSHGLSLPSFYYLPFSSVYDGGMVPPTSCFLVPNSQESKNHKLL